MGEERLNTKDARVLLLWVLAGVIGVLLAWKYFFVAFPEAAVDFRISRAEAVDRGRKFLAAQGFKLTAYDSSIVFAFDDNAKTYLEREVGLAQANRLMASEVSVWYWQVRFFRELKKEEYRVQIDPGGRIVGMEHEVEEKKAGASLEREPALKLAEDFLRERVKADLAAYDFLPAESNPKQMPKRRDWSFTWERRGFKAKDAPYRLRVTVLGDAVGGFNEFLKVPEAFERDFVKLRSSNELWQWVGQVPYGFLQFGAVFGILYLLHMRGLVRWRGALKLGLVLAALFFLMYANQLPLARADYNTKDEYASFLVMQLLLAAVISLFFGFLVSLTVAAGEPLYRRDHPEKLRLGAMLTPDGLRSKEFFRACVIGLAMAAAHIGFVVMFYVLGKHIGFWTPQEVNYTNAVSTVAPWIYPLAISLYAATGEEFLFRLFAIPLLLRATKSKFVALVLPAFVWGFLHSAYPVQPGWARGVEVGIIGVVAGWVMLRWGILATLVWHYTVDAALIGFFLLRSENLYFRLSGAVVAGAVLLPLAFASVAYLARRRFAAAETLFNSADPLVIKPVEEAPAPAPVARRYEPATSRALMLVILAGVLGVVLVVRVVPQAIGSFVRVSLTPGQAAEKADEILRQRKVDPAGFRQLVVFHGDNFDRHANEYLRREVGIEGVNHIYREQVPAAFWLVRYFRPLEKEEYHVVLRTDGELHAVRHLLDEKAPGANLSKEEAQARAQAYLRDVKKVDLAQWKLVDSPSDKRPARTDHTFVWERTEGIAEARVRMEVTVLGDEIGGYRVFVKIPEEWKREQEETSLTATAYRALQWLFLLSLAIAAIYFFVRGLKEHTVPWRRLALWSAWGAGAFAIVLISAWPTVLAPYSTARPFGAFTLIFILGGFMAVCFVQAGLFFLFGFAWAFASKALGEERMPGWRGMPAAYYRDALLLGLGGIGAQLGFSRLRILAERAWPTNYESFPAALPRELDNLFPAASGVAGAVLAGLLMAGGIALVAGFLAAHIKDRAAQMGFAAMLALILAGPANSPENFTKGVVFAGLYVAVLWFFAAQVFRFNVMGYFLAVAGLSLVSDAVQLLRQPAAGFRAQGYVVVAAAVALFAWPLFEWLRHRGDEPSLPEPAPLPPDAGPSALPGPPENSGATDPSPL